MLTRSGTSSASVVLPRLAQLVTSFPTRRATAVFQHQSVQIIIWYLILLLAQSLFSTDSRSPPGRIHRGPHLHIYLVSPILRCPHRRPSNPFHQLFGSRCHIPTSRSHRCGRRS